MHLSLRRPLPHKHAAALGQSADSHTFSSHVAKIVPHCADRSGGLGQTGGHSLLRRSYLLRSLRAWTSVSPSNSPVSLRSALIAQAKARCKNTLMRFRIVCNSSRRVKQARLREYVDRHTWVSVPHINMDHRYLVGPNLAIFDMRAHPDTCWRGVCPVAA